MPFSRAMRTISPAGSIPRIGDRRAKPLQDHPDIASDIDGKTVRADFTFLGDVPRHLMVMGHPPKLADV